MGNLFSKKKAKAESSADARKPGSAPARLEGLDGTSPDNGQGRRAITPPSDSVRQETASAPTSPGGKGIVKKIDVIGKQCDGTQLAAALPVAAVTIPDEAADWSKVFDEHIVRNLFASDWKGREQGLHSITRFLAVPENFAKHEPTAVFLASTQVAERFIKDKVAPLYHASLDLLRELLTAFSKKIPQSTLQAGLDPMMPALLNRCGNLNTRIHEASLQALVGIAGQPNLGTGYVGPYALAPMPARAKAASATAQIFGRLDLVYSLLSTYCLAGGTTAGLGLKETLEFAKQGLEMPDEKVRACAIKVVVQMYCTEFAVGRELEPERYMGPLKPALQQILHRQFDEARTSMGGGGGGGGMATATGNQGKVPRGGLPPMGGPSLGGGRGLPPLVALPKLQGSTEGSGTAMAAGGSGVQAGKPPRKPFQRPPPGRGGLPEIPPMAEGSFTRGRGGIDSVMTDSPPIRNPSPNNLRANERSSGQGSLNATGRRSHRDSGPGNQLAPTLLDGADESLVMYIAGDQNAN